MDWLHQVLDWAMPFVMSFLAKYPATAMVIAFMGTARVILKPIFAALPKFVGDTPWTWDNELLQKVLASKWYPVVSFLFDYFCSVKLPQKPEAPKPAAAQAPAA
jgi:hypothetical protein